MTKLQTSIIKLSQEILDYLLAFKEKNPEFTFSLRERDSVQSAGVKRLSVGYWFQGSTYIYVPLFRVGDKARKIKTIGFVLTFDDNGNITNNYIEISFKAGGFSASEVTFYKQLASFIKLNLSQNNHGIKPYDVKEIWKNLEYYVTDFRDYALDLLEQYNLKEKYIVTESDFQKRLKRINDIKSKLLKQNENMTTVNTSSKSDTYVGNLNQILFGPPGTGKTFNTINKALEIINDNEVKKIDFNNRKEVKALFDKKLKEGQIVFTTFHQSMSYEDFIEGIKPKTINNQVQYEVEDGIFKLISQKASAKNGNFDEVIVKFKQAISELDGKKVLTIKHGNNNSFDVIYRGTSVFYVQPKNSTKDNPWYPVNINNMRIAFDTNDYSTLYNPTYIREILNYLVKEYGLVKDEKGSNKNYVLIIDEINRGNVSQIFGELITLIEVNKRSGSEEALEVTLPYSKEKFSVPPNLYIIGTMNTADRSIEALDTALRRRFSFEEMMPKTELITPSAMYCNLLWKHKDIEWEDEPFVSEEKDLFDLLGVTPSLLDERISIWDEMKKENTPENLNYFDSFHEDFTGINLNILLTTINNRIENLLDRDHTIGHSYFMKVKNIDDLKSTFKNNIIPLLQEYFYGDYEKIGMVLGKGFFEEKINIDKSIFAKFDSTNYPENKNLFKLKNIDSEFDIKEAINSLLGKKALKNDTDE